MNSFPHISHRRCRLRGGSVIPDHRLLIPADLRLHNFQLRTDQQPHLPSELVGEQSGAFPCPQRLPWL